MDNITKNELINLLMKDFKENEGKDCTTEVLKLLELKLSNFTIEELALLEKAVR